MFTRKLFLVSIIFLVALFVVGLILPLGKDEGQRGVLLPWNASRESDVGAVDTLSFSSISLVDSATPLSSPPLNSPLAKPLPTSLPDPRPTPSPEVIDSALAFIMERDGLPKEQLFFGGAETFDLKFLDETLVLVTYIDEKATSFSEKAVLVDPQTLVIYEDPNQFLIAEREARQAFLGKFDESLYQALYEAADHDELMIIIGVPTVKEPRNEVELAQEVIKRFPEAAEAWENYGTVQAVEDDKLSNAIEDYYTELLLADLAVDLTPIQAWFDERNLAYSVSENGFSVYATLTKGEILQLAEEEHVTGLSFDSISNDDEEHQEYIATSNSSAENAADDLTKYHSPSLHITFEYPSEWSINIPKSDRTPAKVGDLGLAPGTKPSSTENPPRVPGHLKLYTPTYDIHIEIGVQAYEINEAQSLLDWGSDMNRLASMQHSSGYEIIQEEITSDTLRISFREDRVIHTATYSDQKEPMHHSIRVRQGRIVYFLVSYNLSADSINALEALALSLRFDEDAPRSLNELYRIEGPRMSLEETIEQYETMRDSEPECYAECDDEEEESRPMVTPEEPGPIFKEKERVYNLTLEATTPEPTPLPPYPAPFSTPEPAN